MVSFAAFSTLSQQSTLAYRLFVGFAGSITCGSLRLKCKISLKRRENKIRNKYISFMIENLYDCAILQLPRRFMNFLPRELFLAL